jgi:hypothetical protein
MNKSAAPSPRCIIIAGPNGAGKTTFAREFLSQEVGVARFVNPDLIASGLSPLRPELAALAAGRLFSFNWTGSPGQARLCLREYLEWTDLHEST